VCESDVNTGVSPFSVLSCACVCVCRGLDCVCQGVAALGDAVSLTADEQK